MFGKRKCDTPPVFRTPVRAAGPDGEREALASLVCASGAEMTAGALVTPSAANLAEAAQAEVASWMYGRRLECSRCKKVCSVTVSVPAKGDAPNDLAVRSKARPDFYALQHAFLPEWFLTKPDAVISMLTNKLDSWQAQTMTQIAGIADRSPGNPMPILRTEQIRTPGEVPALLIDFMTPRAPVEAHHALLVAGPSPRFLLSEKTHLGEDTPLTDMAGLAEWAFTSPERTDMRHTAISLLPEVSRDAFVSAASDFLKRGLA